MSTATSEAPEEEPEEEEELTLDNLPVMMRGEHLRRFLQLGRVQAYKLANEPDFPAIQAKDNGAIRIRKAAFVDWLEDHEE
jgi:hypothetical protein